MDEKPLLTTDINTPQIHAERCVVCNGFGTLKYGEKQCQACLGKGYILVPNFMDGRKDGEEHGYRR